MNDRTPAQSDETLRAKFLDELVKTEGMENVIQMIDRYVGESVAAERSRLLDAVEGVIGKDEPAAQLEGSEARHRIAQSAEQIKRDERNSVRAELRAALKGLREGNDG